MRVEFKIDGKTYTGEVLRDARGSYGTAWHIELDRINKPNGSRDWTNVDEVGATVSIYKSECKQVN